MVWGRQERSGIAELDEFKYWGIRSRSFDWELGKWNCDELVNLIRNCHCCGKSYKNYERSKEHMMERVWVKIGKGRWCRQNWFRIIRAVEIVIKIRDVEITHEEIGPSKDWKNGENVDRFDWKLSLTWK